MSETRSRVFPRTKSRCARDDDGALQSKLLLCRHSRTRFRGHRLWPGSHSSNIDPRLRGGDDYVGWGIARYRALKLGRQARRVGFLDALGSTHHQFTEFT